MSSVKQGPNQIPARRAVEPDVHPPPDSPAYRSTEFRHPKQPLIVIPQTLSELSGPVYGAGSIGALDHDLTRQHASSPAGQRIIVSGRVLDEDDRPVPRTLIEVWQANAAGRYAHRVDRWDAPLDPNFTGAGRTLTDGEGRYSFVTIRPGAYPWRNHHECVASRAHSLLVVRADVSHPARDADVLPWRSAAAARSDLQRGARARPAAADFDLRSCHRRRRRGRSAIRSTSCCAALAKRRARTRTEMADLTPFQTVGPFLSLGLGVGLDPLPAGEALSGVIIAGRLIDGRGEPIPDGILEFWHPSFVECRRVLTNDAGEFRIELARPHAVDGADGRAAGASLCRARPRTRHADAVCDASLPRWPADECRRSDPRAGAARSTGDASCGPGQRSRVSFRCGPAGRRTKPCSSTSDDAVL